MRKAKRSIVMLAGFIAKNHPQMEHKPEVDDRCIAPADFARFHARFHFTVDAAATKQNARLYSYWTKDDDGLKQTWAHQRVWCNPPFSDIESWVKKAWHEATRPTGWKPDLIVMLLPANRTELPWWHTWVEPKRDRPGSPLRVEFLPGRLRFLAPGQTSTKGRGMRPPFGCCLLIWDAANAVR